MRYWKHLIIPCLLVTLSMLAGCSAGRTSFSTGQKLEAEGKYEEAMYQYAEAFKKNPDASEYRARFLKARDAAANQRYQKGLQLFNLGNYDVALEDFQAAYGLNPTQFLFKQKMDLASRLKQARLAYEEGVDFEKANKFKEASRVFVRAVELHPENKEYQAALSRILALRKNSLKDFELSLKSTKPITLKFKDAKLKEVFSILTKLSGINFIFDDTVKDQNITVYLENATFQQAMELLTNMNKLGSNILNETTVLLYPKTPEKIKQYEDMEVRSFRLNYLDAKKAINLIRGMVQVRKIQVSEDSNSILVRDSKKVVDVVEKILDAHDVPDPEVVLDVEVIELSSKNAHNVGLLLSDYSVQMGGFKKGADGVERQLATSLAGVTTSSTTIASSAGGITVPTTTTTTPTIDNLSRIFTSRALGFNGYMTMPSGQYNFQKTLASGEVLSNPKIRVKNKEKSKFNVGTRVPITTTTLNGTVSQVNVQYVDVGVKVNAEPTIQLNNEVSIKLNLEVSSIISKESVGSDKSTTVVTIGTRNLDTVLSLKDGETSIIGGLISNTNTDSKTKVFLLGDLPLIGPLISSNSADKEKTELVLAITPRLVRGVTVPRLDVSSFMSGKEDDPSLIRPLGSFEQEPVFENVKPVSKPTVPAPTASASEAAVAPVSIPRVSVSKEISKAEKAVLKFIMPNTVNVDKQVTVDLELDNSKQLVKAPFVVKYDPNLFDFVSAGEGQFLKSDGKPTNFSSTVDPAGGTVAINLTRDPQQGGVSGNGILASLVFRAKNPGLGAFAVQVASFVSADGKPMEVVPFAKAINITR